MTVDPALARVNAILNGLSDDDLTRILPLLAYVPLATGTILYEAGEPVHAVYFPLTGVVSLVADLGTGVAVETATVGRDGMCGITVYLGAGAPSDRALVEVPGRALAMDSGAFARQAAIIDGPLQRILRCYTQALFAQIARNAACNLAHPARQRAARWLLSTADRMDTPTFRLTQDALARTLAVRRATVNEIARSLADDGCITYTRGSITILDPQALETQACHCYQVSRHPSRQAVRQN